MRARYHYALVFGFFASGCGNDTTAPTPPVTESHTWIGSFTEGSVRGALSLHVVAQDNQFTGEMVVTRVPDLNAPEHFYVRGTLDDSLHLELDTSRIAYQYTFNLDAAVDDSLGLSGTIVYPVAGLITPFTAHTIIERTVNVLLSYEVSTYVRSMVWDGSHLWASTLNDDFLRFTDQGQFYDQVVVFYSGDIHWTSGALTFDGTHLLGFLPTTIVGPGGTINGSSMYEFDATGILRRYDLSHRTWGLAYDGANFWSLDLHNRELVQFNATGATLDSLDIDVPDPYHLEFENNHFWTMSSYTPRLYEMGTDGRVMAVYDVPRSLSGQVQTAIAAQGSDIWYSEVVGLERTIIYKLEPH